MKKLFLLPGILSLFLLAGCGEGAGPAPSPSVEAGLPSGPEAIVAAFYEAEYDYAKSMEGGAVTQEGSVFPRPYREHVTMVSGGDLWDEAYYEETLLGTRALISTKEGWVEQLIQRSRPYGYGEDLTFTLDREEEIDGRKLEVYTTMYTVDLAALYRLEGELAAEVTQAYYIDMERGELARIVTDLADQAHKMGIATVALSQGISLEEAAEQADTAEPDVVLRDILDIYNYGNATDFEIPDIKK